MPNLRLWSLATAGATLGFCQLAYGFSQGSPICDVASLPVLQMSTTLASPPPSGWIITSNSSAYYPQDTIALQIRNTNSLKQARGILIWSKDENLQAVGAFQVGPGSQFAYIAAPATCDQASVTHTTNTAKPQSELVFNWLPPSSGTAILRAFIVEDCSIATCRAYQALTPFLVIDQGFFKAGFE